MRLFPFALTQSEEQLLAPPPPPLVYRNPSSSEYVSPPLPPFPLPFRPPPAATLPELDRRRRKAFLRMRLSPRPLPRYSSLDRSHRIKTVRPSVIQKSVSLKRGVIFRAHKGSEGGRIEGRGG